MKNFLNNKLITGGIIILVLVTIFLLKSKEKSDSEKSIGIGLVIRQDLVQRVTIAGTVTPLKKTVITAPYSGYVKKIYVKIGDLVKRGDPIVSVVQSLQGGDDVFPLRSPLDGVVV